MHEQQFPRRKFILTSTAAATGLLAGCLGDDEEPENGEENGNGNENGNGESLPDVTPPETQDPEEGGVYMPAMVHGMKMQGMEMAGPYMVSMSFANPHDFWLMSGDTTDYVQLNEGDTIHLMSRVWNAETDQILPLGGMTATIYQDGELIEERSMWPMLSQQMGFHFGDNFQMDSPGEYEVEITVDPMGATPVGDFSDGVGEQQSATLDLEFTYSDLNEIMWQTLDNSGDPGAVPPMDMGHAPTSEAPGVDTLPGTQVSQEQYDDTVFVTQLLEQHPGTIDSDNPYLVVSPRTPYNDYALPFMGITATTPAVDDTLSLSESFHPAIGHHYGLELPDGSLGDTLTLSVNTPPQVARHRGYQVAFLEYEDIPIELPETL